MLLVCGHRTDRHSRALAVALLGDAGCVAIALTESFVCVLSHTSSELTDRYNRVLAVACSWIAITVRAKEPKVTSGMGSKHEKYPMVDTTLYDQLCVGW